MFIEVSLFQETYPALKNYLMRSYSSCFNEFLDFALLMKVFPVYAFTYKEWFEDNWMY